ncbi:MAG: sodium:solute symporter family protein [Bacillota bacterium]|nr:sodium:solute symporter family protein [Bacillota bacterium]
MNDINIITCIILLFSFIPLILAELARANSLPSVEDFFICSRDMGTFLAFFTIYSTWYSTFAVMGSSAYFYAEGPLYMTSFAWNALFAVLIFFIGKRIWFLGKLNDYITPTDFFTDIYQSKPLSVIVTAILLVFTLPYIQIQFVGGAYLIELATDGSIPWEMAGFIFYIVMIVYMWAGGLRAVAMADVFLGILVFFTLIATGFFLTYKAGGLINVFTTTTDDSTVSPHSIYDGSYRNIFLWLTMFIVTPLGAIMTPPMWIRHYAIRGEKTFHILPFLITIATAGYIGSMLAGNASRALDPTLTPNDMIIPCILMEYGDKLITAILFCGFAAASLSTANSQIHALSTIYTIDIHKKWINKSISNARLSFVAKCSILAFSIITYAIMIMQPGIIIDTGLLTLSGTAQLLIPTIGGIFWKRSTRSAATAGLSTGIITLICLYFFFRLEPSYCGTIALFANALIFFTISISSEPDSKVRTKIVEYQLAYRKRNCK